MAARLTDDGARGAPLELGPLDSIFGEAALAADLFTAWKTLWGGCASSRLDLGFPAWAQGTLSDNKLIP